jgi:hypothetical protein
MSALVIRVGGGVPENLDSIRLPDEGTRFAAVRALSVTV